MLSVTRPVLPSGWKAEWDVQYQEWYYVNLRTGVSQWEKPLRTADESVYRSKYRISKGLPQGWEAEWDQKYGQWYYANIYTELSQWERPTEPAQQSQRRSSRGPRTQAANLPREQERTQPVNVSAKSSSQELSVRKKVMSQDEGATGLTSSARNGSETCCRRQRPTPSGWPKPTIEPEVQRLYKKLSDPRAFRIVELHKGSASEPLRGTLWQVAHLDLNFTYDALSYRWSDIHPTHPAVIEIDGVRFPIGPNLHAALLQFRSEYFNCVLWVDQICIKQDDKEDKDCQLYIMAEIYSKARKVLVWLGEAGDQSDIAMEFFPIFVEQVRVNQANAVLKQSTEIPVDMIERGGPLAAALKRLFERSWFGRVWTLQEVAMGQEAEVWCGNRSFPFQLLETFQGGLYDDPYNHWRNALDTIESGSSGADPENPDRALNTHINIIATVKRENATSVRVLNDLRFLDCSNDEDRVYSVLRFLDADLVQEIMKQQNSSPAELFQLVAIHEIERGKLEYLSAAGRSQQRIGYVPEQQSSSEACLPLPSWVPDWTYKPRTNSYWVLNRDRLIRRNKSLFAAGGHALPDFTWSLSKDRKIVHVRALMIASKVGRCAAPFRVLQLPEDLSDHANNLTLVQTGTGAFRAYTASCMELATMCHPKHGSSDNRRACRRSLIGGMMPEGPGTTSTSILAPATDEVVDFLFEDFEKRLLWFDELNETLRRRFTQTDGEEPPDITSDDLILTEKIQRETEQMKDYHKKNNLVQAMADACKGRRFFITDCKRYMGVVPDITMPGDEICVIPGCCAPFVIRPKGTRYQLIGECYVDGIMHGELMADEKGSLETISFE